MRRSVLAWQAMLAVSLSYPAHATGPQDGPLAPIVLRMEKVTVEQSGMPSTGRASAKTATEVLSLLTTAVLTFGVPLLDLPRVLEKGGGDSRSAQLCLGSWKEILEGPQPWLKSAEVQDFVLQTIQGEATRLVASRDPQVMVEVAAGGTNDAQRREALREIGVRLSASSVFLTDVSVGVEPMSSGCTARFRAQANLHLETIGASKGDAPSGVSPSLATVSKSETVDVHGWATEPEVGRRALRLALVQLAQEIVQAYPWPRGNETTAPSGLRHE